MTRHRRSICGAAAVIALAAAGCGDEGKRGNASAPTTPEAPDTDQAEGPPSGSSPQGEGTPPSAASEDDDPLHHLKGPSLADWRPVFAAGGDALSEPPSEYSHVAVVTELEVKLYGEPGDRWAIGLARIGNRLPAKPASGPGCSGGTWYEVSGGAHACSAHGLHITEGPVTGDTIDSLLDGPDLARRPGIDRPDQYRYGKAVADAPLLARVPSEDELAAMESGTTASGLVHRWLKGTYLLALTRGVEVKDETFYETLPGRFIRESDLEPRPLPPMHGRKLETADDLPLAFAYRKTELYCVEDGDATACGNVDKHARFAPRGHIEEGGRELVRVGERRAVPREDLRLAEVTDRPDGVGEDEKWIHIHLSEQTLTAYEGDAPVYVTLVSTGLPGHDTLPGLFRVDRKYVSKTMRGTDENGPYEVQQVPWTLYYDGNYAVHGAYWHQIFGQTKSHGCVNVPPADARWLYYWSELELPEGWHAMFHKHGTHVYITGKTPQPEDEEDGEGAG